MLEEEADKFKDSPPEELHAAAQFVSRRARQAAERVAAKEEKARRAKEIDEQAKVARDAELAAVTEARMAAALAEPADIGGMTSGRRKRARKSGSKKGTKSGATAGATGDVTGVTVMDANVGVTDAAVVVTGANAGVSGAPVVMTRGKDNTDHKGKRKARRYSAPDWDYEDDMDNTSNNTDVMPSAYDEPPANSRETTEPSEQVTEADSLAPLPMITPEGVSQPLTAMIVPTPVPTPVMVDGHEEWSVKKITERKFVSDKGRIVGWSGRVVRSRGKGSAM